MSSLFVSHLASLPSELSERLCVLWNHRQNQKNGVTLKKNKHVYETVWNLSMGTFTLVRGFVETVFVIVVVLRHQYARKVIF